MKCNFFFRAAHPDGGEPGTGLGRGILCAVRRAHQEPQMARQGDAFLLYFTISFSVPDLDPDPHVFGTQGSGSGSTSQRYPDPDPSIIKQK